MAKDKSSGLTDKQLLFCQYYIINLNATEAAKKAGYSEKTARSIGQRLLTKVDITAEVQRLKSKVSESLRIDAEWVLKRFTDISNRCMTAEPVMVRDSEGNLVESGEYKFDSSGANKATENIAKHVGFFKEDNEQSNKIIVPPAPTAERIAEIKKRTMWI